MKELFKSCVVVALLLTATISQAQEVSPVDFMRLNPYQLRANPAVDLPYYSIMSLFLGNIDVNVQNTTLRYNNLFDFNAQGQPTTINLRSFADGLRNNNNFLGVNVNADLFTLCRRHDKSMVSFNYGIKVNGDMKFNDGLFKLLGYGNSAFVGEDNPANIDMDLNLQAYQEFAIGYQRNINKNLSIGCRAKLLLGLTEIKTDAIEAQLYTDPDSYALRLRENIALHAALPKVLYAKDGQLMTNGTFRFVQLICNPGLGFDLAADYRINDKFSVVAAVRDLGFIYWGLNNIELTGNVNDAGEFYENGDFLFEGLDENQIQSIVSDDYYREQFLDTLQQYFHLQFNKTDSYNSMLNTNFMLRGNYDLNASNRVSAQFQGRFLNSGFRPSMTLAYSGSFFKMIEVCTTYTIMPGSYDNIGLGFGVVLGTFHLYMTSNNVIGLFKPFNTSMLDAQLGIVFNL